MVCGVYLKFKICTEQALKIGCFNLEKSLMFWTLFISQHQTDLLIVVIEVLLQKWNDLIPEDFAQGLNGAGLTQRGKESVSQRMLPVKQNLDPAI